MRRWCARSVDSIHLRRFCRIALTERVPHESTVRKLTRRLGPDVIDEITRAVIEKATRERRFITRAVRIDSTVVESDIRYPNDAALAVDATRVLAREAKKLRRLAGAGARGVRDRSRRAGQKLRAISRTVARRTGQAKTIVLRLTGEAGELVGQSVREARALADQLRDRARGRGAKAKQRAAQRLDELADLADKIARQIAQRLAGERIGDRLVSMADPDARPIRKGKLRAPTEFGYVFQFAELTENTRRGARGLILPAPTKIGSPNEADLLGETAAEIRQARLGRATSHWTAASNPAPSPSTCPTPARSSSPAGNPPAADTATAGWRATASAPKAASATSNAATATPKPARGLDGARTSVGWSILTYNLDTLAIRDA